MFKVFLVRPTVEFQRLRNWKTLKSRLVLAVTPEGVGSAARVPVGGMVENELGISELCDIYSPSGGREGSTTPVESDLLKYLTAHISPSIPSVLTSFVITREEYLQGILELVKSDCPEVMQDLPCFLAEMKNAFIRTEHGAT